MKSKSSGILAVLMVFACVAQAGAQVEPPYDPSILPQENTGQPTTIAVPEKHRQLRRGPAELPHCGATGQKGHGAQPRSGIQQRRPQRHGR